MPEYINPSPISPLTGRGVPFRFGGINDISRIPSDMPTPPDLRDEIPPASADEGDLPYLTIAQAAALIKNKEISPVELTMSLIKRIERLEPTLNAFITRTPELALEQARKAEEEIQKGNYIGPLHGIPVALKDLLCTEGILTTGATAALSDWIPKEDSEVWRRLKEAGAILLGKLNLNEMAGGTSGLNQFYGPARNPWNIDYITGGSSSGSGAAIAASMCLGSVGSDTGGSIRYPASFCGITVLKPTFGLVSTRAAIYLSWTRDHFGPMTKTAQDAAIMLNIMAGYDPMNPLSAPIEKDDYEASLATSLKGMRLIVPAPSFIQTMNAGTGEDLGHTPPDPEVLKAVDDACDLLRSLGAEIIEVNLSGLENFGNSPDSRAAFSVERAFYLEQLSAERLERFGDRYRDGIIDGKETTAMTYLQSLHQTQRASAFLEQALGDNDALILPTTIIAAPLSKTVADFEEKAVQASRDARSRGETPPRRMEGPMAVAGPYIGPINHSGQPALSIPCGFTKSGLPIGLMIVGKRFTEAKVLGIGHAYQQATSWHTLRPI